MRIAQPFGQSADPAGRIVFDPAGNLYFADTANTLIRKIDADGHGARASPARPRSAASCRPATPATAAPRSRRS